MTEYSVPIVNRFALGDLSEDEDLHELLEKQQEEKKKKDEQAAEAARKAAEAAAAKTKNDRKGSAKAGSKKPIRSNDSKQPQSSNTTSKPFQRNDENRPPRFANRQPREGTDNQNFEKPPQSDSFGGRGRRGAPRGRGFGGGSRGGKREYDRHSGSDKTGVKAVEKREGNGPHNWGDQIEAQMEQLPEGEPAAETTEADTTTELNDTQEPEPVVEDEAPKEMTLAEYKAAKQGQSKAKAEFNVRKANEGADQKQWKGTVALQKKKKGEIDEDDDEEYIEEESDDVHMTRSNLEKLNIQITFADSGRSAPRGRGRGRGGGGFRGGRGGRGGRGFGDHRGDKTNVPRVDNESDFPTLGSR